MYRHESVLVGAISAASVADPPATLPYDGSGSSRMVRQQMPELVELLHHGAEQRGLPMQCQRMLHGIDVDAAIGDAV